MLPIFTVTELGWTNLDYSRYYSTAKLVGGIAGMILGGFLMVKYGKMRMLNVYFVGTIFFIAILSFSKAYWGDRSFIYAFMIIYNLLYTFACIGIFAIAMQCCWKKVSASQFTLYMTIANLGQMSFAGLIGPVKANYSWTVSLFFAAIIIALAWLVLQFLKVDKQMQAVVELEKRELSE